MVRNKPYPEDTDPAFGEEMERRRKDAYYKYLIDGLTAETYRVQQAQERHRAAVKRAKATLASSERTAFEHRERVFGRARAIVAAHELAKKRQRDGY